MENSKSLIGRINGIVKIQAGIVTAIAIVLGILNAVSVATGFPSHLFLAGTFGVVLIGQRKFELTASFLVVAELLLIAYCLTLKHEVSVVLETMKRH
jgi:hypothetical protein